jgi:SHS2 domain-containing protein
MQRVGRFAFEVLEHTADKAIVAHGETFEQMLESAAAGMFAQEADLTTVLPEQSWEVEAESETEEDLLVEWLRELLLLSEREEVVLCDFVIQSFSPWKLKAKVWGSKFAEGVQRTGAAVKAVTYHKLSVKKAGDWQGRVTFDV